MRKREQKFKYIQDFQLVRTDTEFKLKSLTPKPKHFFILLSSLRLPFFFSLFLFAAYKTSSFPSFLLNHLFLSFFVSSNKCLHAFWIPDAVADTGNSVLPSGYLKFDLQNGLFICALNEWVKEWMNGESKIEPLLFSYNF